MKYENDSELLYWNGISINTMNREQAIEALFEAVMRIERLKEKSIRNPNHYEKIKPDLFYDYGDVSNVGC